MVIPRASLNTSSQYNGLHFVDNNMAWNIFTCYVAGTTSVKDFTAVEKKVEQENFRDNTLVPDVFLEPREPRRGEVEMRNDEKRKTSGYLGIESHFHADASCQTCYKRDQ